MVIAIGTGVIKANEPKIMKELMKILNSLNVGLEKFLKYMDWAKRKGTTGKVVQSF